MMRIELDTGTASPLELAALAALIDVLAGRGPPVEVTFDPTKASAHQITGEQRIDAALTPVDHSDEDAEIVDAAVLAGAPDFDSAGLPWDERIHAASRATIADGTWRKRRNVPDETYEAVTAELRAASSATLAPSPDDTPPPPVESAPVVTESSAAAATTAAEDVPPPPASDGPDLSTFPKFVQAVNGKDVPADKKTYGALNELCATFGVAAFKDMKDRPNDWAMFYEMVG